MDDKLGLARFNSGLVEIMVRQNHKHKFKASALGSSNTVYLTCKCGGKSERPMTAKEKVAYKKYRKKDNTHKVWKNFCELFTNKNAADPTVPEFKYVGAELGDLIERWAKKYPNDVKITGCDDTYFSSSLLVFIEHKDDKALTYMGTTVVFIPQCSGEKPITFFLYPGHTDKLIEVLKGIRTKARPIQKAEDKKDLKFWELF